MFHAFHTYYENPFGVKFVLDITDTPDCGLESAFAIINEEAFLNWWFEGDDDRYPSDDEWSEWCEECPEFTYDWVIVTSHGKMVSKMIKELYSLVDTIRPTE